MTDVGIALCIGMLFGIIVGALIFTQVHNYWHPECPGAQDRDDEES